MMHCYSCSRIGPSVTPPASVGYQPNLNPYIRVSSTTNGSDNAIDNYMKPRTVCLNAEQMKSFESCAQRRQETAAQLLEKQKNAKLSEASRNPVYGLKSLKTSFISDFCVLKDTQLIQRPALNAFHNLTVSRSLGR